MLRVCRRLTVVPTGHYGQSRRLDRAIGCYSTRQVDCARSLHAEKPAGSTGVVPPPRPAILPPQISVKGPGTLASRGLLYP